MIGGPLSNRVGLVAAGVVGAACRMSRRRAPARRAIALSSGVCQCCVCRDAAGRNTARSAGCSGRRLRRLQIRSCTCSPRGRDATLRKLGGELFGGYTESTPNRTDRLGACGGQPDQRSGVGPVRRGCRHDPPLGAGSTGRSDERQCRFRPSASTSKRAQVRAAPTGSGADYASWSTGFQSRLWTLSRRCAATGRTGTHDLRSLCETNR